MDNPRLLTKAEWDKACAAMDGGSRCADCRIALCQAQEAKTLKAVGEALASLVTETGMPLFVDYKYVEALRQGKMPTASGPDYNCPDNCVSESSKCPAVGWFIADNLLPMCPNYTPPAPSLFQTGGFTLHYGGKANWKIDCDALTRADWDTLALMVAQKVGIFSSVVGVPQGGLKLAHALQPFCKEGANRILIVDDVLTTGKSMEELRAKVEGSSCGAVVFARGECPSWVMPLFRMGQPSPVTAEKLAEWMKKHRVSDYYDWPEYAESILKAFPTLGSGRLTRDDLLSLSDKRKKYGKGFCWSSA